MRIFFLTLFFAGFSIAACSQQHQQEIGRIIDSSFSLAARQYKLLEKNTPDTLMPRNYGHTPGQLSFSNTQWWCSGFFPGSLWYIYEFTHDEEIKRIAEKRLAILEKEKKFTGNHDLGFMMYCSFGNAYRLTGNVEYLQVIKTAAGSLATRFRGVIQSFQSWEQSDKLNCPVIIDNMMNLELLYWASDHGGDPRYRAMAIDHSNSTIRNHFRPDNSSYHVLDYDLNTGKIIKKITWQGAADSSAWARGQSWGLYGFTMMYRFSKNKAYLEQAQKIARFLIHHPNLPADKIPYWDYNAPGIPGTYRDASAGAIMACALLELARYSSKKEKKEMISVAEQIILSLSSPEYLSKDGEAGGFLIKHNVGSLPHKSEVDASLTYADYYYLEALHRYQSWYR
ncbi:MAG: glycoside hydrolase family 88 protein [Chitinophagaceae bacterium]|nr:glycoside hydrolase family 88 protein [Chitinophagaceae bacterium]